MKEQIKLYTRNPLITLAMGGVIGGVAGSGGMYIFTRWRNKGKDEALVTALEENEQMSLDFDRQASVLEQRVQEAGVVVRELRQLGANVAVDLNGLRNGDHAAVMVERVVQPSEEQLEELATPDIASQTHTYEGAYLVEEDGTVHKTDLEIHENHLKPQYEVRNVFGDGDDTWDYELEQSNRTKEAPYIIHVDEFVACELDYEQSTLSWYEGDEILTDSQDIPIHRPENVVGELRFGHGSQDPNVVYVRNEELQAEYEILRNNGSYETIVLGNEVEREYEQTDLKHSRSPLRFRPE